MFSHSEEDVHTHRHIPRQRVREREMCIHTDTVRDIDTHVHTDTQTH